MSVLGVIALDFEPYWPLLGLAVPIRALGVAAAIMAALVVAAVLARRHGLRADDLLFIALGIIPGAVIGGRLMHVLAFNELYRADPLAMFDPARGSLSLLGAVLGGALSGAFIASRLDGDLGEWLDTAAIPLLMAVGGGKLAELLAGAGQGTATDLPWAVAFASPGPWVSSMPAMPAHPAQIYEGLWALVGIPVVASLLVRGRRRGSLGSGVVFAAALSWWLAGRIVAAATWRDVDIIGPLCREQIAALFALALAAGTLISGTLRPLLAARAGSGEAAAKPPD